MIFIFYQEILKRRSFLVGQIKELQKQLKNYPAENLIIWRDGRYFRWFKSDGKSTVYIPKKEKELAVRLAQKKYYSCLLEDFTKELSIINSFIKKLEKNKSGLESLLNNESFISLFSEGSFLSSSTYPNSKMNSELIKKWKSESYEKNPKHPEQLKHRCLSGEYVRSKSEVIIANALFTSNIPYRYECALTLGGNTFYPDFTILNPQSMKIKYWEHFGMMDAPKYSDQTFNKLKTFSQYGIIPGINLITTYETGSYPIDSEKIQLVVNEFLD